MQGPTGGSRLDPSNGRVVLSEPGAPWWAYQRPEPTGPPAPPAAARTTAPAEGLVNPDVAPPSTITDASLPSGVVGLTVAAGMVLATAVGAIGFGLNHLGVVLFPIAAVIAAFAFGHRCRRLRPEEPWLPRLILLGTVVKIGACAARYVTFAEVYQQIGDAFIYDREGRELVAFWNGERATDPMGDLQITGSGLIRWLTGIVYYVFGQDLLAAFFLFGLLAVIGSYFWYRALVDAVPYVNARLFLIFVLFVPSIVFWPASLGKEALMQVALGAMAWATSLILRGRLASAVPLSLGGGLMLYLIRPHLLALVTVAAAVPYFVGRIRVGSTSFSSRPLGMVIVALLVVFTVTAGSKFVGLENLSIDSVEEQLDAQTVSTSYGGSTYSHPGNSLTNPLFLPNGVVTVLFRPFLWESHSLFPLMAAVESTMLLGFVLGRFGAVRLAFRRCRKEPFILYCLMLLIFYSAAFSSLANFGLLTRQRSLVLPALYAIIAIEPARLIKHRKVEPPVQFGVAPAAPVQ